MPSNSLQWTKRASSLKGSADHSVSRSARGFTLIELMVVVLVIGLLAATMVISVGVTGRDQALEKESERAFALIKYAREKAELQTREFGLYLGEHDYQFLTFDPRKNIWRTVDEDDSMRLRELPDGLNLRLVVEGREVILSDREDDSRKTEEQIEKEQAERVPHVMLFSNGDLTPFQLTLERDSPARRVTIESNETGVIEAGDLVEGTT
jgi:general secretion pathway protein H